MTKKTSNKPSFKSKKLRKLLYKNKWSILAIILLIPIFILLYKIYIPRSNAFGCFDDCNNFMRGYFVLHGKALFSQVFSGHQPFGSYLSTIIQFATEPSTIHELILRHRQFIILFSLLSNIVLILRFGPKMILFTILYEFSKFYIFGDRFLGESMAVYPSIYMAGIVVKRYLNEKIYKIDYYLSAIFCWFVIFMRETFIPLIMLTYFFILFEYPLKKIKKVKIYSLITFVILSLITVFAHDIKEYFYNVVYFNAAINLEAEKKIAMIGSRPFHWFLYPLYVLFYGSLEGFKFLLFFINLVFLGVFIKVIREKKYLLALFIFLVLGLSNIRPVIPGHVFYEAFHMVIWYGLIIFFTIYLLFSLKLSRVIILTGLVVLIVPFVFFVASPNYFGNEKINTHDEFITHYGYIIPRGEVIKSLSNPGDSLFLDDSDDMIYWQAKRFSDYRYSWYTSAMPQIESYKHERIKMFKENPPDFYREYGSCPKETKLNENISLPSFIVKEYVRLNYQGKESCIFIHKDKLKEITPHQWQKAKELEFSLSE